MEADFVYVETKEQLQQMCKELKEHKEIAVDLECENNLHHYGAYISLIQISSKDKNWIVDVLGLKDLNPLIRIFENDNIIKIFHDVSFDFRILNHELKCVPKNVVDTQVAAVFLGKTDIGLGPLLKEYFDIQKQSKFQMADWTKRPISKDMLSYAMHDTLHLIDLKEKLFAELSAKNRLKWVKQEFKQIEQMEWPYKEGTFLDVKGIRLLNEVQRGVLKRLFSLRERLARRVDRPVHFVISTKRLKEIAVSPPRSKGEWKQMRGVHPIVRAKADWFYEAVSKGKRERVVIEKKARKRLSEKQKQKIKELEDLRTAVSEKVKLPKHLILSRDQITQIAVTGKLDGLRKWQKELIEKWLHH